MLMFIRMRSVGLGVVVRVAVTMIVIMGGMCCGEMHCGSMPRSVGMRGYQALHGQRSQGEDERDQRRKRDPPNRTHEAAGCHVNSFRGARLPEANEADT